MADLMLSAILSPPSDAFTTGSWFASCITYAHYCILQWQHPLDTSVASRFVDRLEKNENASALYIADAIDP
jgi:hypothetical protein